MPDTTQLENDTEVEEAAPLSSLAEIGLHGYAPYLMNRIMGRYNINLRGEMTSLGISTAKMRALAILSVMNGIQIGKLGIYAVVEQSTLSRALDGLGKDGLVRREIDPEDQRSSRVYLTETGRAAFDQMWPHMADSHDHMFKGIGASEREAFLGTLHKMLANIRKHDI